MYKRAAAVAVYMTQMWVEEPTITDRERALLPMLEFQRADFEGLFRAMKGYPVTIRTLDPPLHEFLPHDEAEVDEALTRMTALLG